MNFKELVQQAEKNAKRQERKVDEAKREMHARQLAQLERLAYEKARAKLDLKRRAAHATSSATTQHTRTAAPTTAAHVVQRKRAPSLKQSGDGAESAAHSANSANNVQKQQV